MKKRNRKTLLYFSSTIVVASTVASVVSCAGYNPTRGDLSTRHFLSGKHAYNKTLADYYQSTVAKMFADKNNTMTVDLATLKFDTYQWTIEANAMKDPFYWTTQRELWIKEGTFINTSKGSLITDIVYNKDFVEKLFDVEASNAYGDNVYVLKNDMPTFTALGGGVDGIDKGSGIIMDVDRTLYSMAYLLLTTPEDVQNWLVGDPNDPDTAGKGKLDPLEKNAGQYFFIDFLRQTKPFIMWKNEVKNTIEDIALDGTIAKGADIFNPLSNTIELENSKVNTLRLDGPTSVPPLPPFVSPLPGALTSYAGFQTTNPFTKTSGGPTRGGDIAPHDEYMKATSGGKQGWVNNNGDIDPQSGNAVHIDESTHNYAYVQQLLPGWDKVETKFDIPKWMTDAKTHNTDPVDAIWNVAFQIIFYGSSTLESAKNYWVNNGYNLEVYIPVLESNLGPEHIYK